MIEIDDDDDENACQVQSSNGPGHMMPRNMPAAPNIIPSEMDPIGEPNQIVDE